MAPVIASNDVLVARIGSLKGSDTYGVPPTVGLILIVVGVKIVVPIVVVNIVVCSIDIAPFTSGGALRE